jgi:hypothetical protein
MASLFGGDTGGTYVGGRRRPTNAGYGDSSGLETRTNGDTTFGGASSGGVGAPSRGVLTNVNGHTGPLTPNPAMDWHPPQMDWTPNAPPPAPNYGWLNGYDYGKLTDPTHNSAKYQIGRTLATFNPTSGFNDSVLAALNALGFGQFSGSGDHLSLSGVTGKGMQAGLDPHNFTGDFIQNWTGADPNDHSGARWTYDAYADPETATATAPGSASASPDLSWITQLLGQQNAPAPMPAPAPAQDLSWLGPLLAQFTQASSQPTQQPNFTGGYVSMPTPGNGAVGSATQNMALQLSHLLQNPQYANDPLIRQLLSTIGGGN